VSLKQAFEREEGSMAAIWRRPTAVGLVFCLALSGGAHTIAGDTTPASNDSKATVATSPKALTAAELRVGVKDALRALATAKDPSDRDVAARQLIAILLELKQDQNLPHDDRVQLHTQVRSRLQSLERALRAEQAARERRSGNASSIKNGAEA